MEYQDSARAKELTERAHRFMEEVVLPYERDLPSDYTVTQEDFDDLREQARDYDIYCPQIGEEWGGMGEDFRDALPVFEEAGRSLLGAPAMRVDAPDEGNMHTIEMVGTEAQKEEYLRPLVEGELRSCFSMTEPMQGAGSDPKMIKTSAEKDGDEWVISGHKWWSSYASESDILLVMARTDEDAHPYEGCSFFIVPTDHPDVEIIRDVPHLGQSLHRESHAEVRYHDVRVPEENLLGEENMGFQHAQQRLGPARLTHCMRYAGQAKRSLEVAKAYISEREAFGEIISRKQAVRHDIAEAEMQLHAQRTMIRDAADKIASGEEARIEVAMAKVFCANVCNDVIDTALQALGGNGIAKDLPVSDFYENVRAFRIFDGADEVHLRTIARNAFEDVAEEELENVTRY
ncbi:MAG: acyl-CoA dehydrogenase family protein [Haloarculaceae archaeon]